jgi:flagellar export protein FliJ
MPPYRLQALLEIRERAEQQAKEAFAEAMRAYQAEVDRLQAFETELKRMIEERHRRREAYSQQLASGEMKITDQSAAYRFVDRLKEKEQAQQSQIEGQREIVRDFEKALKRAQDDLLQAKMDLQALEKHREKWANEVKRRRAMRMEDEMDEVGQILYQSQGKSE